MAQTFGFSLHHFLPMNNCRRVSTHVASDRFQLMKTILVVDDDKYFRQAVATSLRRQGYEVIESGDGADGLAQASTRLPSLVLSDVNMGGRNGFELLKELRTHVDTASIPVIMMTGEPQKADVRFSMEQGADDYLTKPFAMETLLSAVAARLQRTGIDQEVQAQQKAERLSAAKEIQLQTSALEAAANGIVITKRNGKILWVNRAFTRLTGYNIEEVIGQNPDILKSGLHPAKFYEDLWATILSGNIWQGEMVNRRKDGSLYDEEMTITPVSDEHGKIQNFIAIKQDVSGRKQNEQLLARERDLLQSLMDNLPDHIYFKDVSSRFIRVNRAMARHLGLALAEDAIGKSDVDFFPSGQARQKLMDEQLLLATGQPILGLVEKSDTANEANWVSSTKVPVYGADGKVTGLVGISRDITAYKEAELERQRMEVQLRQSQKLESVGQLAAGIAHEINTPTQYVGDNTRFVKDSFVAIIKVLHSHEELLAAAKQNAISPELLARNEKILADSDLEYLCEQIPSALSETLEGIERVSKIVRAMKDFSHPGGKDKTPADLNRAIESTVTVARNEWKYVADLKLELEPDLPPVPCFIGEFNQCILNLVVNAAHAIGDVVKKNPGTKGGITIRTQRDGDHVEVRVSDTGTGIAEAHRKNIFEPFFTTKDVGKGTGQGLTMIYGCIVNRHGGTVTFETELGKGTTFIIRLPLKPQTLMAAKSAAQPEAHAA
jgi:PAS domain S-box-containing protein